MRGRKDPAPPKGWRVLRSGGSRVRATDLYYDSFGWRAVGGFYSNSPYRLRVPPCNDPEKARPGDIYRRIARKVAVQRSRQRGSR